MQVVSASQLVSDTASGSFAGKSVSDDGNFVVFTSTGMNLVPNDTNGTVEDVYLFDRAANAITLVSSRNGGSGNGRSYNPVISGNGNFVAFQSEASLAAGDTNIYRDIYLYDRVNGTVTLVSHNTTGGAADWFSDSPSISDDGNTVAFSSGATNLVSGISGTQIYLYDRVSGGITLASRTAGGSGGNNGSFFPVLSGNGNVVVFESSANNLTANSSGNNSSSPNLFAYARDTGTVSLVSRNLAGTNVGNSQSMSPSISDDGNFIAFESLASDLAANDTNGQRDVFLHDRTAGTNTLVSHSGANPGNNYSRFPSVSDNGAFVVFTSGATNLVLNDVNNCDDVFVWERANEFITMVSQGATSGTGGNNHSFAGRISTDGSTVAFASSASDLVPNDTNGSVTDVFVAGRTGANLTLVSRSAATGGSGASPNTTPASTVPVLSGNGSFVAFQSDASNLVLRDYNNLSDVFLFEWTATTVSLVSRRDPLLPIVTGNNHSPPQPGPVDNQVDVSADGNFVVFTSSATNLAPVDANSTSDVFLYDRAANTVTLVSRNRNGTGSGNNQSLNPKISADGNYIVFQSYASDLVLNDTNGVTSDVFLYDRRQGTMTLVSNGRVPGTAGNNSSEDPTISDDGSFIAFSSIASNLVDVDTNNHWDVFVYERATGGMTLVSRTSTGGQGNNYAINPVISGNGRYVAFEGMSALVPEDANSTWDVYLHDRSDSSITLASRNSAGTGAGSSSSLFPSVGDNGNVAFSSNATNLAAGGLAGSVYLYDRGSGTVAHVGRSQSLAQPFGTISANGNFVVFQTNYDIAPGDTNGSTDVVLYDHLGNSLTLVSPSPPLAHNGMPSISNDGNVVAYSGRYSGPYQVYTYHRVTGRTRSVSRTLGGASGNGNSGFVPNALQGLAVISGTGNVVVFGSEATNLVVGDFNQRIDLFAADMSIPLVEFVARPDPSPTSAGSVTYRVTFSEDVTGVDASDFAVIATGITGAAVTNVTAVSGSVYTVTVSTGTGTAEGTLRLDVLDDDTIRDADATPLGGTGTGNGGWTLAAAYTISKPPAIQSIVRAAPSPTNAATVAFTVTFSEDVTGVGTADFSLTTSGLSGASITGVTPVSGSVYTVTANTGSGQGTLRLDVRTTATVQDTAGNALPGTGFTTGESYTIDRTAPAVTSSVRADPNPSSAGSVRFTVTFSEAVSNVDTADFTLTTTGGLNGASLLSVVPVSGSVYTVTVNTGGSDGTLRLDVPTTASIHDTANNALPANGFTAGESYMIDKTAPAVVSSGLADPSPTSAAAVRFTVTFSETVSGVDASDFELISGGLSGASITNVTAVSGSVYTVTVNTGSGDGSLRLDVPVTASIQDTAGNALPSAGFTAGESYIMDRTPPAVVSSVRADPSPTNAGMARFTVTFSESVTGVNAADFNLTSTGGISGTSITGVTSVSGSVYTVTVDTGSGDGFLRLDVRPAATVQDLSGNILGDTGFALGETCTIDRTAPAVISSVRADPGTTNAASVRFTVTFSESVTGVDAADFALTTTGSLSGISVSAVAAVSGSVYTITVNTGSGDGTLRLDVPSLAIVNDAAGNALPATSFTAGESYVLNRLPPPEPVPVSVSLVPIRTGAGKPARLVLSVPLSTGEVRQIVSPFQKPRFANINAFRLDSDGDGIFDSVLLTARKGKKRVARTITL